MDVYSGEASRASEAFLAQFRLYARKNSVLDTERVRQSLGKVTGSPQLWYTPTFANDRRQPEAQIALVLRKRSVRSMLPSTCKLLAVFHVTAQPTQSGAQRLLALDQREEQVS